MTQVIFIRNDGSKLVAEVPTGATLLEVAQSNGLDVEGTCEGSMACSTCHMVIAESWYNKLPPAGEEELDMLDLTYGLTRTSRLGCQLVVEAELDGLVVSLPQITRNMME